MEKEIEIWKNNKKDPERSYENSFGRSWRDVASDGGSVVSKDAGSDFVDRYP
jgi:hypothetical protein